MDNGRFIEFLEPNGFIIIKEFIAQNLSATCLNQIKQQIEFAAQEINTSSSTYIQCTGRWASPSRITSYTSQTLDQLIQRQSEQITKKKLRQKKSNIICKTAALVDCVPFHQDISYSHKDPYHFTVWLSLTDTDYNSGTLLIIKKSHKNDIEPAVDFWYPYFEDSKQTKTRYKIDRCTINVKSGDAVIFDSRVWHGSSINNGTKERFTYVTRWNIEGLSFPYIPEPINSKFGMWNCGTLTEQILADSLKSIANYTAKPKLNKQELVVTWIEYLTSNYNFLDINSARALSDLNNLLILDQAFALHNAGDISGKIYKKLWFSLLQHLNKQVNIVNI